MRSRSGERPACTEGATMGRAHRLVSAVSEERLAGMVPLRRVPATSLMLLRCESFRRSTRHFGGEGAAYTLSMRSRHDRLPNTSGRVPATGTLGTMSKHSPPTVQSTPHVHSQFAKSTPSKPATSLLWDSQGIVRTKGLPRTRERAHRPILNTPGQAAIGPHLLASCLCARQP